MIAKSRHFLWRRSFRTPISSLDPSNNFFSGLNTRVRPTEAYILDGAFSNESPMSELLVNIIGNTDAASTTSNFGTDSLSSTGSDTDGGNESGGTLSDDGIMA